MKKLCIILLVMALFAVGAGQASAKKYTIGTVVKVDGIAWFDRMREGVEKFGEDTGHETFLLGPPKADAALQVQIIEDLIAQGVDAITVVPFSPEALEPVLKKAMDQGIVVISHEATNQQNVDYDIEAFDNAGYGSHLMDHLAKYMGEEGEYAVFVGSLTSKSHNEWVDAAIARQKDAYPKMTLVTERIEEYDDQTVAYEKTKELLKTYPELRGIQGSAMSTAPGAGLAVEEKGLQDKVMVVGTSLVSVSGQYLESGGTKLISFWDPADAGYAMNTLAVMVLEGKAITEGLDLGLPGYNNLKKDGKLLFGSAWVDVTTENMDDYDF
ncbi:LacI family transcriptional regulator [candidate division KSB3 bacterium]|uniref:LacI family transcriptional regulator n=1 Tax=candidate division KSB3 bacterium TaxID=2044937 RepID=A0A2G6E2W9_9BACT|nr:MAG: LacI family transcriptional regulator [candidate division KSB3 bacterium]PIE28891.1 MAG: LacI family transcriptional regulator [candidate division KSB3 bacterium]